MEYDRVKEIGDQYNWTYATKYQSTNSGASYTPGAPVLFITNQDDYYRHYGMNTPKFHQRLKAGELLPYTPWRQSELTGGISIANHELIHGTTRSYWKGFRPLVTYDKYCITSLEPADLGFDLDQIESLKREMIQAAAANIYSSGWDGLTFIAELKETLRMFRGLFQRVLKTLTYGKWSDLWLEGRYGWRTLLYDMQDLAKLIDQLDKSRDRFKQRVGRQLESSVLQEFSITDTSATRYYITQIDAILSVRGSVIADISPPRVQINPFVTAWEITKLSFVFDWFIHIGTWLESLSFIVLSDHHASASGYHLKVTKQCSLANVQWSTGWSGDSSFVSIVAGKATVRSPQPIPLTPFASVNLDWLKVDDLLALAWQTLTKRR
jgi:hypothetical protein